jgi:hypothetical protein
VYSPWKSASGVEFIQDAETSRRFGHAIHAIAVLKIKGKKFTYDLRQKPWVRALDKFFADHPFLKTIACEQPVWSKYGFAGTFDWLAEDGKRFILIDWKSSVAFFKHWREQTAAYAQAIQERFEIKKPIERWTVRLMEDNYRIDRRKAKPEDWHNFLSLLNCWKLITKE